MHCILVRIRGGGMVCEWRDTSGVYYWIRFTLQYEKKQDSDWGRPTMVYHRTGRIHFKGQLIIARPRILMYDASNAY